MSDDRDDEAKFNETLRRMLNTPKRKPEKKPKQKTAKEERPPTGGHSTRESEQ